MGCNTAFDAFNRNIVLVVLGFILVVCCVNISLTHDSTPSSSSSSSEANKEQTRGESQGGLQNVSSVTNSVLQDQSKGQLFYNCSKTDSSRWSNRPHRKSRVNSLFNCDKEDAFCEYYYPANFFDTECGLGKEFSYHIDDAKAKKLNGTLWNFMPSIGFPTLTMNDTCLELTTKSLSNQVHFLENNFKIGEFTTLHNIGHYEENGFRCFTERLSFLHVHKAGGSSLHSAFNFMSSSKTSALARHKFFTPSTKPFAPKESSRIVQPNNSMINLTLDSLSHATRYPDKIFDEKQHIIFAVVRDPTERFISSIGQALGAVGSGGNHIAPTLKQACIKETSAETLKCLAHYVRDHGFWIELHFTPQVIDISFTTMWQDVPVAVFPFKHLKTILSHFGREDVKVRDGSNENYRSHPVLTEMSVKDYDEESLQLVCEIYEMDVRMQRSLGFEVPRCDPFIPR
mmetsp:Transcript_15433/g.29107  ORF Transcript_15433/g.29107 Transcript_15433/m.29107 type:complete len:456 (+) Transcript_15433:68-1435(+)